MTRLLTTFLLSAFCFTAMAGSFLHYNVTNSVPYIDDLAAGTYHGEILPSGGIQKALSVVAFK